MLCICCRYRPPRDLHFFAWLPALCSLLTSLAYLFLVLNQFNVRWITPLKICILWHHFLVLYLLSWECMPFFTCRRFGTWTVAKLTGNKNKDFVEGPICNGTQVIGWHVNDSRRRFRRFHADMSGFAFNSTIIWDPKRWHRPTPEPIRQLDTVRDGFQVSSTSCHLIHWVHHIAICSLLLLFH
jgi:hypothetical protein